MTDKEDTIGKRRSTRNKTSKDEKDEKEKCALEKFLQTEEKDLGLLTFNFSGRGRGVIAEKEIPKDSYGNNFIYITPELLLILIFCKWSPIPESSEKEKM